MNDPAEYRKRWLEIPPKVREITNRNALANRIAQEYAAGNICYIDEALAQMVIGLGTDWERQQKAYIALAMQNSPPVIIRKTATEQFQ